MISGYFWHLCFSCNSNLSLNTQISGWKYWFGANRASVTTYKIKISYKDTQYSYLTTLECPAAVAKDEVLPEPLPLGQTSA